MVKIESIAQLIILVTTSVLLSIICCNSNIVTY